MFIFPIITPFLLAQVNSYIRLLHASPDAPAVDIYANEVLLARNLKYKDFTEYLPVPTGRYNINVFPTGSRMNPVLNKIIDVRPNSICTVAAINPVNNLDLLCIIEPKLPIQPYKAMVRFVHLSPNAPAVDITLPNGNILFKDVEYKEIEEYIPVDPNNYTLQVRASGTDNVVLTVPNINLLPNRFYTVYAVGLVSGNPQLQVLIPLDGNSYIN